MSYTDVAFFAADFMLQSYPQRLRERFALETLPATEIEFLELAGAQRGCLGRGGRVDLERIATLFLNELRDGTLGPITLEMPSQIAPEEAEVARRKAEKQARDEQRRARRKAKSGKPHHRK